MPSLALQENKDGQPILGSSQQLRDKISSGADLRLGLQTKNYYEVLTFPSVSLMEDEIVGHQAFHSTKVSDTTQLPYEAAFRYSTRHYHSVFRWKNNGASLPTSLNIPFNYERYDWLTEDNWQQIDASQAQKLSLQGVELKVGLTINKQRIFSRVNFTLYPKDQESFIAYTLPFVSPYGNDYLISTLQVDCQKEQAFLVPSRFFCYFGHLGRINRVRAKIRESWKNSRQKLPIQATISQVEWFACTD